MQQLRQLIIPLLIGFLLGLAFVEVSKADGVDCINPSSIRENHSLPPKAFQSQPSPLDQAHHPQIPPSIQDENQDLKASLRIYAFMLAVILIFSVIYLRGKAGLSKEES